MDSGLEGSVVPAEGSGQGGRLNVSMLRLPTNLHGRASRRLARLVRSGLIAVLLVLDRQLASSVSELAQPELQLFILPPQTLDLLSSVYLQAVGVFAQGPGSDLMREPFAEFLRGQLGLPPLLYERGENFG